MKKHLFLLGSSPPFLSKMGDIFSNVIHDNKKAVAIICIEREGWQEYMPRYESELIKRGVKKFQYIHLPNSPIEESIHYIEGSSGIIICGGDTSLYANYIVDTAIGLAIKKAYLQGILVAGFSAGALICMNPCVISPDDNDERKMIVRNGLGLVDDMVIAVHFSEWQNEAHLLMAVTKIRPIQNYGIDEGAAIYLCDNLLTRVEGNVYQCVNNEMKKIVTF